MSRILKAQDVVVERVFKRLLLEPSFFSYWPPGGVFPFPPYSCSLVSFDSTLSILCTVFEEYVRPITTLLSQTDVLDFQSPMPPIRRTTATVSRPDAGTSRPVAKGPHIPRWRNKWIIFLSIARAIYTNNYHELNENQVGHTTSEILEENPGLLEWFEERLEPIRSTRIQDYNSDIARKLWNCMSDEEKAPFDRESKLGKQLHKQCFPNYVFRPQKHRKRNAALKDADASENPKTRRPRQAKKPKAIAPPPSPPTPPTPQSATSSPFAASTSSSSPASSLLLCTPGANMQPLGSEPAMCPPGAGFNYIANPGASSFKQPYNPVGTYSTTTIQVVESPYVQGTHNTHDMMPDMGTMNMSQFLAREPWVLGLSPDHSQPVQSSYGNSTLGWDLQCSAVIPQLPLLVEEEGTSSLLGSGHPGHSPQGNNTLLDFDANASLGGSPTGLDLSFEGSPASYMTPLDGPFDGNFPDGNFFLNDGFSYHQPTDISPVEHAVYY